MAEQENNDKKVQAQAKNELKQERKKLKDEQKQQKKVAKARAKELTAQAAELAEDSAGGKISTVLVTVIIILIWLAILAFLIKIDVGGFGSGVLAPILKDVPVVSVILPKTSVTETTDPEAYGGYTSLRDAVDRIKELEAELEKAQSTSTTSSDDINALKAEVERLQTFEKNQVEFQKVKTQFYEEVVYAEKGPGAEAFRKYYESIDPTTAEFLYKQVAQQEEQSQEIKNYAKTYSEMKPKEAAGIFEAMKDNLNLAAQILGEMGPTERGKILGVMNADIAAKITKIMDPNS